MFKVNKKDTRTTSHWRRSDVFIVNFEHTSHLFLGFLLLTLSKCLLGWKHSCLHLFRSFSMVLSFNLNQFVWWRIALKLSVFCEYWYYFWFFHKLVVNSLRRKLKPTSLEIISFSNISDIEKKIFVVFFIYFTWLAISDPWYTEHPNLTKTRWAQCDAFRDLLPFAQFKKREKHPWRKVTFGKVAG